MLYVPGTKTSEDYSNLPNPNSGVGNSINLTANVLSSWSQVHAALPFDTEMIAIVTRNYGASLNASSCLCDIGIGPAGSEIVLVDGLAAGYSGNGITTPVREFLFPLGIKAGTRVAVRAQGIRTAQISIQFVASGLRSNPTGASTVPTKCASYGVNRTSGVMRGVAFTPGAFGAKGSWFQLTGATVMRHSHVMLGIQGDGSNNMSSLNHTLDIGIGSAGSEVVVAANLLFGASSTEFIYGPWPCLAIPIDVPAGERIAVRAASGAGSTPNFDAILYGFS